MSCVQSVRALLATAIPILAMLFIAMGAPSTAAADSPTLEQWKSAEEVSLPKPGPPPPADQIEGMTLRISKVLRCPVCQGLSVAGSPSETAVTMKNRVRELVTAGYDQYQIENYFVGRYGEWVLLDPTQEGLNKVLVVVPVTALILLLGLGLLMSRQSAPAVIAAKAPSGSGPSSDTTDNDDDEWERKLLAEADE